ncbi:MAG TPA: metallophosphoesterase [Parafilimonas sp.]|nr:metallophosphoesterase [Parafilimonas sp.]
MRTSNGWWIVIAILLIIDLYVFTAVRFLGQNHSDKTRTIIYSFYWAIAVCAVLFIISFPNSKFLQTHIVLRNYVFAIIVGLFFAKLIAAVFFLLDDIRRLAMWLMAKIFPKTGVDFTNESKYISRSAFLSWAGFILGGGLFTTLLIGFSNKYNYKVRRVKLTFNNLPSSFKGLKIVQVSDIHSGSFTDKAAVERGVDIIRQQNADLILFTGDLVNDKADEMHDYMDVFDKIKAPMGVFSTLGNHDYGDYTSWPSAEAKTENLERLKKIHGELGWRLLMNEHVALEKNNEQIALLGIENWSAFGRFPKYGRMDEAYPGTEKYPFKILMSHDPSHWDAEVRPKYPDIDLTLAGHTHGMQFGVENPYFKWSPVQWFYKEWAGLYENGKQKLYVNRGYGFIGYPGRVGILPEITVFELT